MLHIFEARLPKLLSLPKVLTLSTLVALTLSAHSPAAFATGNTLRPTGSADAQSKYVGILETIEQAKARRNTPTTGDLAANVVQNSFLDPNERHPIDAFSMLQEAPAGAYVAVGTERCFMMAVLLNQITRLVCIDRDPQVVLYNMVNTALLKLSSSRQNYLNLRLNEHASIWQSKAKMAPHLSVDEKALLSDDRAFAFWHKKIRNEKRFAAFHTPSPDTAERYPYGRANYLFEDSGYARLAALAKEDAIQSDLVQLSDDLDLIKIFADLDKRATQISVVDISNAWWKNYGGIKNLSTVAELLVRRNDLQARVVYTTWINKTGNFAGWSYGGADIQSISHPKDFTQFLNYMARLERRATLFSLKPEEANRLNSFKYIEGCRELLQP